MRRAAACVPLNLVALQRVAQLFIHLFLLSVCQHHNWPAFTPLFEQRKDLFGDDVGPWDPRGCLTSELVA